MGYNYADAENGSPSRMPFNLLELMTQIYIHQLASQRPATLVDADNPALQPVAKDLELALNQLLRSIRFEVSLRQTVADAIFSVGILKVGIAESGGRNAVVHDGEYLDAGQPYAEPVSLDDFVIDMSANRFADVAYVGHRYRLTLEQAQKLNEQKVPLRHEDTEPYDEYGNVRTASVSRGEETRVHYKQQVELWDLWLPQYAQVITCLSYSDGTLGPILRSVDWEGPATGPYHLLGFSDVPDQLMPLSPVANLFDLNESLNIIFRKLKRQAENQKQILGTSGAATDDALSIQQAGDLDIIRLNNADQVQAFSFNGPDQANFAFLLQVKQVFSYLAGNLDSLGGLSAQAETATQDQLLAANASKRIQAMQLRVIEFVGQVTRSLAWYLMHDPLIELPLTRELAGGRFKLHKKFTASQIRGEFQDYNFSIEPYSMTYTSPQQRLGMISMVVQQYIMPMAQLMAAQGIQPDMAGILKTVARYANIREIEQLVQFSVPSMPQQVVGDAPVKAPTTTRQYDRVVRPGATRDSQDAILANTLMGAGQQKSQVASVGRDLG